MHTTPPDTISLFAGPGGMDIAAENLGLNPLGIEHDAATCRTRHAAGLATLHADVRGHGSADLPNARRALLGGPPCQTYSATGTGTGRAELQLVLDGAKLLAARQPLAPLLAGLTDPRTGLVLEPLRWALEAIDDGQPFAAIVLEQVPAALPVWHAYAEHLRAEGYHVATGVLRTEEYGVPQTRRRAALIARLDRPVALPAPTHRRYRKGHAQTVGDPALSPWQSMGDTLPGRGEFTTISNYGTGGDPKARGRRTSDEPAFTVTGKVDRTRLVDRDGTELPRLTPAEAGLLQGFPADHPWSDTDTWQQIGNACPPPLAAALITATTAA